MATKKETVAQDVQEAIGTKEETVEVSSALNATINGDTNNDDAYDFGDGLECGEMTLSQLPTIKLTQSMTPEVQDRNFPDIYAGMYINDMTKEILGEEIEFRLIGMWQQRVKFPAQRGQGTTIECSCPTVTKSGPGVDIGSEYGYCKTCPFNNFNAQEHCQIQYTLIMSLNDNPHDLYRLILSRTSFRSGTVFANALRAQQAKFAGKGFLPMFMFNCKLKAKEAKNAKLNASYFISSLEVVPVKEMPEMDADLKEEYKASLKQIMDLRKAQINTALTIAQEKLAERQDENSTKEEFNAINSSLAEDMGFGKAEPEATLNKDEIPF